MPLSYLKTWLTPKDSPPVMRPGLSWSRDGEPTRADPPLSCPKKIMSLCQKCLPRPPCLCMSLGRNVFRDGFLSLAMDIDPGSSDVYRTFGDRYDWFLHIPRLPSLTPALENALLATCTARLGQHTARPALVQKSLELYTTAVSEIRRAILTKSVQDSDQNLAACLSLLLYEAVECPGRNVTGHHARLRGCLELLRMRGADDHYSGLARSTLQILRLHTVISNQRRGKTFLAQPEWLYLPWSSQPNSKSLFDRLVDILLTMPNGLEQIGILDKITDSWQLLQDLWTAIEEGHKAEYLLQQWFESFQVALPAPLYHTELSTIETAADNTERGKLFPVAFRFPDFMVGQSLVLYWVALMTVQGSLYWTYATLTRLATNLDFIGRGALSCTCGETAKGTARCLQHFTVDDLPEIDHTGPRTAAYNICQSAEYFVKDTTRGF
ncbi:hypothetical protein FQN49_007358 [Arthroderma sp. PD_2]|nr:hypothetical protein FQN49_007358 [Arthroderma sp. PD_2]